MLRILWTFAVAVALATMMFPAAAQYTPSDYCSDTLAFSLSSSIVRVGEAVAVRASMAPLHPNLPYDQPMNPGEIGWTIFYPAGIRPLPHTFTPVLFPQGVFDGARGKVAATDQPEYGQIHLRAYEGGVANSGAVADLDFQADASTPPGQYELTAPGAVDRSLIMECWQTPGPITAPFLVTAPSAHPGDVNGDQVINVVDAFLALKLVTGALNGSPGVIRAAAVTAPSAETLQGAETEPPLPRVTVRDAVHILHQAVHLPAP